MPDVVFGYLRFELRETPGRSTEVWDVLSRRSGAVLGQIRWYGAWRQYVLHPDPTAIFSGDCLHDIADFARQRTRMWAAQKARERASRA
jgi:hypothetical protein